MMEPEKRLFILDVRREHKTFRDAAHLFGTYEVVFFGPFFYRKVFFLINYIL